MLERKNGNGNGQKLNMELVAAKVPPALNPEDSLNSFVFSMGGDQDRFNTYQGIDGIPHRAFAARPIKEDDPDRRRPQSAGQVGCETYDVSIPEEKLAYMRTVSRIYSLARQGKAMIVAHERQFIDEKRSWLIFFEWIEFYSYDPVHPRESGDVRIGILRRS